MPFLTKDIFIFDHTVQGDYPNWTPSQTKQNFNARTEELRLALNAVANLLNATTSGASGAKNVAMTPIASFGTQANVQDVVEALILRLQAVTASLSGAKFIGVETIAGLTGNDVQTLLAALKIAIDNVVLGAIPDASLTYAKLAMSLKTLLTIFPQNGLINLEGLTIGNFTLTLTPVLLGTVTLA